MTMNFKSERTGQEALSMFAACSQRTLISQTDGADAQSQIRLFIYLVYVIITNLLVLIISPIILGIFLFFVILNRLTNIYLKLKYGKIYGGLLSSGDAIFKCEDNSKSVINSFIIINMNDKKIEEHIKLFISLMKKNIYHNPKKFQKFTSLRKSAMGYGYLLKNQANIDECITIIDPDAIPGDYVDEAYLTKFISSNANRPMPMNDEALWEILILPKPIHWNEKMQKGTQYPVMIRFHHILGDGFAIYALLIRLFAKDAKIYEKSFTELINRIVPKQDKVMRSFWYSWIMSMCMVLYVAVMAAPVMLYQFILKKGDKNALHGPKLTGQKHLVFALEKETKAIDMIKDIRRLLKGCSFSHILFTAYSAALADLYKKVSPESPDFVSIVLTAMLQVPKTDEENAVNSFSAAYLNLPINLGNNSIVERFRHVKRELAILAQSPDLIVNNFMMNYLSGLFPTPILKRLMTIDKYTASISIVPGLPMKVDGENFTIQDIFAYSPNKGLTGLGVAFLSYNSRLQIGVIADKALISDVNDAQFLADSMLEHIYKLYKEILLTHNNILNDTS